ncbi:MAG: transketolase [Bacteroidetes bacterium]|nr:transketolase [Bacteroidota bacterium]
MSGKNIEDLQKIASQVRRDILRMVHAVNSGHPGGSLGCTDFFVALYFKILDLSTDFDMDGKGEDVFFLSNGHISPVWYSVLARRGFFPVKELSTFRKLNSRLQGHPATEEGLPGIRIASGSLGQGLSVACGAALAKKLNKDEHLIYALTGDGELQEGQNWEAIMYAAHNKIDNLIATVDYNNRQIDGDVSDVLDLMNLGAKFESFGWEVLNMNGNDFQDIFKTMEIAKSKTGKGKPIVILMKTEMGQGVDYMMGSHAWHGKAPNDELLAKGLAQLEESLGDY